MTISRRTLLSGSAALLTAAATGAPKNAVAQAGGQVVIGTWGGDYGELLRQLIDQQFTAQSKIEVLQDIGNNSPRKSKLLAERQNRRGSMDVSCLSDSDTYQMMQQNVLDKLATDRIPRLGTVIEALRKDYAVPHIYSAMVILYNPSKVTTPPTSYADLWDAKWRGRVGLSDILYNYNTAVAALAGGGSMSDFGPANKRLMDWRSLDVKIYPSNEALATGLKSEEVWLAPMWLARGYMWKKAGIPLNHVVPKEGAVPVVYEAAVPRNARNKDNAWRYLNAMLEPQAQIGFAERMGYVPTVRDAQLPAELAREISLTEAQQATLKTPDHAYLLQHTASILDFWNKDFKG
ncbi:ABC transporter substrate-binding protein [Bradyrhizobium sp. LHD-71]|uniref:ABC transporter substrate-binding protein n=1 Tax=Bradyrhizobium sp. LHD-71 TaxID=3072141 RepID=UPI00280F7957|nr:ABC transporter substrate-binding protein [Bradyrhizobium sp. LHD-71]MDQ8731510.1 ABC transporter substrate-binding protein [Bradyrhizobium sp. LHD-71]